MAMATTKLPQGEAVSCPAGRWLGGKGEPPNGARALYLATGYPVK